MRQRVERKPVQYFWCTDLLHRVSIEALIHSGRAQGWRELRTREQGQGMNQLVSCNRRPTAKSLLGRHSICFFPLWPIRDHLDIRGTLIDWSTLDWTGTNFETSNFTSSLRT